MNLWGWLNQSILHSVCRSFPSLAFFINLLFIVFVFNILVIVLVIVYRLV